MEFLPKPLWQKFGISTIFKDILGLSQAQIAAVVSGCITSCTCVCISEGMFVLKKADFFSAFVVGPRKRHWVFQLFWKWSFIPGLYGMADNESLFITALWTNHSPQIFWHINRGRRDVFLSVQKLSICRASFCVCVHQGALETTDPLELLQHNQGWYFVG